MLIYDSGWVTGSTINAAVNCAPYSQLRVILAASGTSGGGSASLGWQAGGDTPVPWSKSQTLGTGTLPLITGVFPGLAVAQPAPTATVQYYFGLSLVPSGAILVTPFVPSIMNATLARATSGTYWGRVIMEGR